MKFISFHAESFDMFFPSFFFLDSLVQEAPIHSRSKQSAKRKDTYFDPKLVGGSRRGGVLRPLLANLSTVTILSEKRGLGSAL